MDINKPTHRKWVGLLTCCFIPGSAHWLSCEKRTGVLLFAGVTGLPMFALTLFAIPAAPMVFCGMTLLAATSLLFLWVLGKSYRPLPRRSVKGWIGFALAFIGIKIALTLLLLLWPAKPYQMPTSSMAPTLVGTGIATDLPPSFLNGRERFECIAKSSGRIENIRMQHNQIVFKIAGQHHALPASVFSNGFRPEPSYHEGDTIWSGVIAEGDHFVANKLAYLFHPPQRGDIVIFNTYDLDYPGIRNDTQYIKRIVGLPSETIQIDPPRLIVNGTAITTPAIFQRLEHQNAGQLFDAQQSITLGPDEYLTLGDNTDSNRSLDGRFYGSIHRDSIIGKAATIYWPFDRIGVVE